MSAATAPRATARPRTPPPFSPPSMPQPSMGAASSSCPRKLPVRHLRLRSRITLELSAGATLTASRDRKDFAEYESLPFKPVDDAETTYFRYALLTGENLQHVAIRGPGVIDGNREKRGGPKPSGAEEQRTSLDPQRHHPKRPELRRQSSGLQRRRRGRRGGSQPAIPTASTRTARVSSGFPTATSTPTTTPSA